MTRTRLQARPRSDSASGRAVRLSDAVCDLTGERDRRGVLRLAGRHLRRERRREVVELGYLDLGDGD